MIKRLLLLTSLLWLLLTLPKVALADQHNFVTIVNPIRGDEFWDQATVSPEQSVASELAIVNQSAVPATWLLRFDALNNSSVTQQFTTSKTVYEEGLLLEVTPSLTTAAGVTYHKSTYWHDAGSIFLTGYNPDERKKLIDTSFAKFKQVFGEYPKSVGAWWIDGSSLDYMQTKYGITASLEVADQYSTDNYQIWGQYWGTPYYPAKMDALRPAQNSDEKVPVVLMQWASRDPVNGYGNGVEESTYSLQANDYLDYHQLTTSYFNKLIDIYTTQKFNQFNQVTVGLENSYINQKYSPEFKRQLDALVQKQSAGQLQLTTMSGFSNWYLQKFTDISPTQIIVADDPLGGGSKAVWFMDPFYRAGWLFNQQLTDLRDVRQYVAGTEELCLTKSCSELNFATTATRVLDSVSFGQSYLLDRGGISAFKVALNGQNYQLNYLNTAGTNRQLTFMPRDLSVDGKVSSIDTFILNSLATQTTDTRYQLKQDPSSAVKYKESYFTLFLNLVKFLIFVLIGLVLPGLALVKITGESRFAKLFLSLNIGLVVITLTFYLTGFIHNYWFSLIPIGLLDILYLKNASYRLLKPVFKLKLSQLKLSILILVGVVFQTIPTLQSGWIQNFGMGFWGPNGHDGVWHLALAGQISSGLPPSNPVFAGLALKNYHYLYDLLIGVTSLLTQIPVSDLIFRFYPILFSGLLGVGTYLLAQKLFKSEIASLASVYFVYFSGSFGWIVSYIKDHVIAGESDFWANQSSSFNLNPPFAISLVLVIAMFYLVTLLDTKKTNVVLILIGLILGSLVGFKSYAAILGFGALGLCGLVQLLKTKQFHLFVSMIVAGLIGLVIYLPNFTQAQQIFIFSPFWLIHTMIDFPDRVGWERLSGGRMAYIARGDILKLIIVEVIGFVMFLVGNLGMRVLSAWVLIKTGKVFVKLSSLFMATFALLGLVIPLLFVQTGTAWNVVQFFYYFLYLGALLSGYGLWLIYRHTPKVIGYVLIVVILIITPLNAWATVNSYLTNSPHTFVSFAELDGLSFLRDLPTGTVLTNPYDKNSKSNLADPRPLFAYETTAYVSALSHKPTFVEDEIQQDILQTPYLKRVTEAKEFFNNQLDADFLKSNHISYIYALKFYSTSLDQAKLNIINIYENKEVIIYKVGS